MMRCEDQDEKLAFHDDDSRLLEFSGDTSKDAKSNQGDDDIEEANKTFQLLILFSRGSNTTSRRQQENLLSEEENNQIKEERKYKYSTYQKVASHLLL